MDMPCEICGKNQATLFILLEGAKMSACRNCGRDAKLLHTLEPKSAKLTETHSGNQEIEELIDGYGKAIKQKREQLGLQRTVIAERIREKESYIEQIEHNHLKPTIEVARKLEKELGIKLFARAEEEVSPSSFTEAKEATLGEFLVTGKKNIKI